MMPTHNALLLLAPPDRVLNARPIRFFLHPRVRYVCAWLLALGLGVGYLHWAWHFFNEPRRRDGNIGHVFVDFSGQWLLGRMVAEGHGRSLYHRGLQRDVLQRAFPIEDEVPAEERKQEEQDKHDVDEVLSSMMGRDDRPALASLVLPLASDHPLACAIFTASAQRYWERDRLTKAVRARGGPLYPPVHAMLFAPVSRLSPRAAYRTLQAANILFAFLAGLGIRHLLGGRVWWPIAATGVIVYPGFPGTCCLGQNAPITLAILVWGWVLAAQGRPGWGGVIWGLFAYKPVWALAFFLVPLLTGRWRMCASMIVTGTALAGLTLPVVGVQTWFDWLEVGRLANRTYDTDVHWIFLSRDLLSIPRRWLLDFSDPWSPPSSLLATVIGWALLVLVLGITASLAVLRRQEARAVTGPAAAFLFLGAWLCCFHFMYYDVLLTALPVFLLFSEPKQYLRPVVLVAAPLDAVQANAGLVQAEPRSLCLVNNVVLTLLGMLAVIEYILPHLDVEVFVWIKPLARWHAHLPQPLEFTGGFMGTPWSTFVLIGLWLWCAWLWVRGDSAACGLALVGAKSQVAPVGHLDSPR